VPAALSSWVTKSLMLGIGPVLLLSTVEVRSALQTSSNGSFVLCLTATVTCQINVDLHQVVATGSESRVDSPWRMSSCGLLIPIIPNVGILVSLSINSGWVNGDLCRGSLCSGLDLW
jgi:hypothetical protein